VANDFAAREVVQRLFEKARGRRIQIRHLEVTMADLREAPRQLSLFEEPDGSGAAGGNGMDQSHPGSPDHGEGIVAVTALAGKERRDSALTVALDRIRSRFGGGAVGFKRKT
jgi:hypothetical protein